MLGIVEILCLVVTVSVGLRFQLHRLNIQLCLVFNVILYWGAVATRVLQQLHLEVEKLFIQVIHAAGQRSMALLYHLFVGLEPRKILLLSCAKLVGSDAVSLSHFLYFRVLFANTVAAAHAHLICVSMNPSPARVIVVFSSSGIEPSGLRSCALTKLRLTFSSRLFGWLL